MHQSIIQSSLEHTEQVTIRNGVIPYTSISYRPSYHVYRAGLVTILQTPTYSLLHSLKSPSPSRKTRLQ